MVGLSYSSLAGGGIIMVVGLSYLSLAGGGVFILQLSWWWLYHILAKLVVGLSYFSLAGGGIITF